MTKTQITKAPAAHDHADAATALAALGHTNPTEDMLELAARLLDAGFAAGKREVRDELAGFGEEFRPALECIQANGFA